MVVAVGWLLAIVAIGVLARWMGADSRPGPQAPAPRWVGAPRGQRRDGQ